MTGCNEIVAEKAAPKPGDVVEYNYSKSNNPDLFGMEYKSPKEAYAAISRKDGIKKFEVGDIEGLADIDTGVLWVFTTDRNPAHPAVMKQSIRVKQQSLYENQRHLRGE